MCIRDRAYTLDMDIIPPVEGANMPEVTPEQRAENNRRMALEDSIRNAYEMCIRDRPITWASVCVRN